MLESLLKSMLPDGFDMNAEFERIRVGIAAAVTVSQTVARIEQKLDSEIVRLNERVAALESVHQTNGENNDDSNGATGNPA